MEIQADQVIGSLKAKLSDSQYRETLLEIQVATLQEELQKYKPEETPENEKKSD